MEQNSIKTKILVINFGGIGDQVLFFPALRTLRQIFQVSHITFVTESRSACASNLTRNIDEIITCDIKDGAKNKYSSLFKLLFKIKKGNYDIVISSGSPPLIALFLFLTGIKKRIGYNTGALSKRLLTKAVKLNKNQYAANMYHDLITALNKDVEPDMPDISVEPENLIWANSQIGSREKHIITIHPGVSKRSLEKGIIKNWAIANWFDLIKKLVEAGDTKIIITGGPDDKEEINDLRKLIKESDIDKENIIDLFGYTKNICDLAAIISLSDLFLCVDSAPMHIAVGTRTPMVAIFGPTDYNKLLPLQDCRFNVIENKEAKCRPCLWDKRQTSCKKKKCLNITSSEVLRVIENTLI